VSQVQIFSWLNFTWRSVEDKFVTLLREIDREEDEQTYLIVQNIIHLMQVVIPTVSFENINKLKLLNYKYIQTGVNYMAYKAILYKMFLLMVEMKSYPYVQSTLMYIQQLEYLEKNNHNVYKLISTYFQSQNEEIGEAYYSLLARGTLQQGMDNTTNIIDMYR